MNLLLILDCRFESCRTPVFLQASRRSTHRHISTGNVGKSHAINGLTLQFLQSANTRRLCIDVRILTQFVKSWIDNSVNGIFLFSIRLIRHAWLISAVFGVRIFIQANVLSTYYYFGLRIPAIRSFSSLCLLSRQLRAGNSCPASKQ